MCWTPSAIWTVTRGSDSALLMLGKNSPARFYDAAVDFDQHRFFHDGWRSTSRMVPPSPPPMTATRRGLGWVLRATCDDHFVVHELVSFGRLHHAVQDEHAAELFRVDDGHVLIAGMFFDQRARHFARDAHGRRLQFGEPQFHKKGSPVGASEPVTPSATAVSNMSDTRELRRRRRSPHFSTGARRSSPSSSSVPCFALREGGLDHGLNFSLGLLGRAGPGPFHDDAERVLAKADAHGRGNVSRPAARW